MGFEYGRNVIGSTGIPLRVSAAEDVIWMPIGITIDWSLVTAVGQDTTIPFEQLTVKNGMKYLRYGQVLTRVTAQPVQTLTITATGGTYALYGNRIDTGAYVNTGPIAFDANAAAISAALHAVGVFNTTPAVVAGTGPYTITSPIALLNVDTTLLTGGTATMALTTPVANSGKMGPYDPTATDGRQTLGRGNVCILNSTVLELGVLGFMSKVSTNHPGALVGGTVFRDRILATTGAHSLAAGPTFTELEAALPSLRYAGVMGY
jgi:hypothetical protein